MALVYSVIIAFATWYYTGRVEAAQENMREIRKSNAEFDERTRKSKADMEEKTQGLQAELANVRSEMRADTLRRQIYLLARLHDYSRELSFWRDTIRKLLTSGGNVPSPDKVCEQVTASLRTFGTLDQKILNDFEAIKIGAELLNRGKRNE